MTAAGAWAWEIRRGSAELLHTPDEPSRDRRVVREMLVDAPAIVLGSSQADDDIDVDAARRAGVAITRRRSGGGAVLLIPGEHVWYDVWLPAADPLWLDDVGRAGGWLADVWIDALAALGVGRLAAHQGAMVHSEWSARVCFAGLGPGEVTADTRKLVGVSQRRTRRWARFQCLVHRHWDADATFGLLRSPAGDAPERWRNRVSEIGEAPLADTFRAALEST